MNIIKNHVTGGSFKKRTLKYGDYILLASNHIVSTKYYSARSLTEGNVKMVSERVDRTLNLSGVPLTLYPNFNELVFKIYPKLNYDTLKEFKNLKPSDHRYELLKRRLEADQKQNEELIKKMLGKPVKYGDTIQLYHDMTNGFIKVSNEKEKKQNLFRLKLAEEGCDEVHLDIVPTMSLKKEGQSISYDDHFSLVNQKFQMTLIFPKESHFQKKNEEKGNTIQLGVRKETSKDVRLEELPSIHDLPICEQNKIFKVENAFSTNISSRFRRRVPKDMRGEYSSFIRCVYVNYSRQKDRKDLRYGDFIQLQSVGLGLSKFKKGYLASETNFSGFGPSVKYRIATNPVYKELITFDSIFQIIPIEMSQYGLPLEFKGRNSSKICLKHFLSGRLLTFKTSKNEFVGKETSLVLSEDFMDFAKRWMQDPKNEKLIKSRTKEEGMFLLNNTLMRSLKKSSTIVEKKKMEHLKEFIAKQYFEHYTIVIVREAAADEDQNLLTSNLLEINDHQNNTLVINNKENNSYKGYSDQKTCTYFESSYYKACQDDLQINDITFIKKKKSESFLDTFIMQHVGISTINKIIHYVSILTPLIKVLQSQSFTLDLISEAENAVKKLTSLLKTSYDQTKQLEKGLISKQVQNAFREVSILDLCVKFIYIFVTHKISKHREEFILFLNNVIILLDAACSNNKLNCFYVFQWHNLFIEMILKTINPSDDEKCKINVDQLISTIFEVTGLSPEKTNITINNLLQQHTYSRCDIKELNLLFSMIKAPKESKRPMELVEVILKKIVSGVNFFKIFRPFKEMNNRIFIEVNVTRKIFIDKHIKKDIAVIEYVKRNIELATELCKEQPSLFISYFNKFIPEKLCIKIIIQEEVSSSLRSCLLDFYVASYLSAKCLPIPLSSFPDLLKIREEHYNDNYSKVDEKLRSNILKDMDIKKSNLKDFVFTYLQNPENYIRLQPNFLESLLDFAIFLIKRQFFLVREISDLKYALFNFLKYFMSFSKSDMMSNLTEIMMETKLHKKGSTLYISDANMKHKVSAAVFGHQSEDLSDKNKSFILKMIKCLKYIESTIFDLRFEYIAHDKDSQEFFDITDVSKRFTQNKLNKILTEKLEKREDFMVDLSRKVASPSTHYTFTLVDLMSMDDLEISQQSLEVLIELYDVRYEFMKRIPYLQVVQDDQIMKSILLKFLSAYKSIFLAESKITKIRNPDKECEIVCEVFSEISNQLSKALRDIAEVIKQEEAVYKKTKGLINKHGMVGIKPVNTPKTHVRRGGGLNRQDTTSSLYLNLFNEILLNFDKADLKQRLLMNLGFIDQIFRVLGYCNGAYFGRKIHEQRIRKSPFFLNYILFEQGERIGTNSFLKYDLVLKCLIFLIFCSVKNSDLQFYIRKKIQKNLDMLFELIYGMNVCMVKYFMTLLIKIYSENLTLLVKIPQNDQELIEHLVKQFCINFKSKPKVTYYTFLSLFSFSGFKELKIDQNQIFISDIIKDYILIKNYSDLTRYIAEDLQFFIQNMRGDDLKPCSSWTRMLDSENIKVVENPLNITICTRFFRFIADICENKKLKSMQDNQLLISTTDLATLISNSNDWWELKGQLFRFITHVYLQNEMEESDWDIITQIALNTLHLIVDYKTIIKKYNEKVPETIVEITENRKHIIYIEQNYKFPVTDFVSPNTVDFVQFNSQSYEETIMSCIKNGYIPFLKKYIDMMPSTGSRHEREILTKISKDLKQRVKGYRSNLFAVFKRDYMPHVREVGPDFAEENFEHDEAVIKTKIERNRALKKEIKKRLDTFEKKYLTFYQDNPDDLDNNIPVGEFRELSPSLYYNYWIEEVGKPSRLVNLNSNFIDVAFYDRLREEDTMLLVDHLLGLKAANKKKFNSLTNILFQILGDSRDNRKAKQNSLYMLRSMIKEAIEKEVDIIMDMVEQGSIEILCKSIIRFAKQPEYCVEFVRLCCDILGKEEREIQDQFYNFIRFKDPENEFFTSIKNFLQISYARMRNSEQLRKHVSRSIEDRQEDLTPVLKESQVNMENVIACLEMLRLFCEGHNEAMQNYLREQIDEGVKRVNSINMIKIVTEILIHYKGIVDDTNVLLGNQIFQYFVELLQGPCIENQLEICQTKMLETVEDMLIDLIEGGKDENGSLSLVNLNLSASQIDDREIEKHMGMSEATKSDLIKNIIEFMLAIIEGSQDSFIISKASIHVNQDMFLLRMLNIYKLFDEDINKNIIDAFKNFKAQNLLSNKLFSSKSDMSFTRRRSSNLSEGISLRNGTKTGSEKKEGLKVLVDSKRKYNPIIMEGIMIFTLLSTIADLESSFKERMASNIKEKSRDKEMEQLPKVIEYFEEKTASIEIININKNIQKIYFPVPYVTKFLSDTTKSTFEEDVNRESANEKIKGLVESFEDFFDEMQHYQMLNSLGIKVKLTYFDRLKDVSLVCVLLINLILLYSQDNPDPEFTGDWTTIAITGLGMTIMIIYFVIGGLWTVFNSRIDFKKTTRKLYKKYEETSKIDNSFKRTYEMLDYFRQYAWYILINSYLFDLQFNIICAILGVYRDKLFFSFMLLDIINRSAMLKNVIKSVTLNVGQFLMTGLLGIIFIYIFTSVTYFSYLKETMVFVENSPPDYVQSMCTNYIHCFLTMIGFGLRSGGGIGETIEYPDYQTSTNNYISRFTIDFLFFMIINVIYLNILFGIIIDTFAELRDNKKVSGE